MKTRLVQEHNYPWRRTLGLVLSSDSSKVNLRVPACEDHCFEVDRQQLPDPKAPSQNLDGHWFYLRMQLDQPNPQEISLKDLVALDQPRSVSWPGLGS